MSHLDQDSNDRETLDHAYDRLTKSVRKEDLDEIEIKINGISIGESLTVNGVRVRATFKMFVVIILAILIGFIAWLMLD